ncbi:hypothetical protein AVEN_15705-1 [Araneus ventricosus]|uniref:Uncharacterized protein n=1 Tax=Araneus ventricosus TaxID=182803 RepID=A0A4Y2JPH6_ARAVE|nr:hypothetical protein AVEN_15705-1 [Araneus ventricosus]
MVDCIRQFDKHIISKMNSKEEIEDVTFECEVLTDMMDMFKNDFERNTVTSDEDVFQIPDYLQSLVHVWFFHEETKPIESKNTPKETILVDMIKNARKNINVINQLIQSKTNGFLPGLDPITELELQHPEFRCLLLSLFYLKSSWDGQDAELLPFHNLNGQTKQDVPFLKLLNQKAIIVNNRIQVDVLYETNNLRDLGNFVRFTKPARYWNKSFKDVTVYLPKLEVDGREETVHKYGKIILNFKYKQDEKGFEAACLFAQDSVDGVIEQKEVNIYFDEPFQIEIYAKNHKVFQVNINNM